MLWSRWPIFLAAVLLTGCPALYTQNPRYGKTRTFTARHKKPVALPRSKHPLETQKGRLPRPVKGQVVSSFGYRIDPKYGTKTKNQGIDIACKPNSPVIAVGAGTVSYADYFIGYGPMIILEHGGGFYSVYARLRQLKAVVGTSVKEGETIALSDSILHFEFRVGGKPIDPSPWLSPE
ncbi:MAG: peptidoglycan DD-metalloendopeptidase family protein [candidate division WOR-3 bacterium]